MKITLTRVLETAKILSTEIGEEIPEFFEYMSEFVDQVVRTLRNGLTFRDNFDCEIKTVAFSNNVEQVISVSKPVSGITYLRALSQTSVIRDFGWYYDDRGRLTVKVGFDNSPTNSIDVTLLILF